MNTKKTKDRNTSVIKAFKAEGMNFVDYNGREYTSIKQMAKAWGMSPSTLYYRIRNGWSIDDALRKPVRKKVNKGGN